VSDHTPTPWEYVSEPEPHVRRKGGKATLLMLSNVVGEQKVSDLKHAVNCVNAHDELVAALKALTKDITESDLVISEQQAGESGIEAAAAFRAAFYVLAKLEGGAK
jgi:hypothetical protein